MRTILLLVSILFACSDYTGTLPDSVGRGSEIIIVVSDDLWDFGLDTLVQNTLATPLDGVGKKEVLFKPIQVNPSEFNSILKKHQNIVIINTGVKNSNQKNKWSNNQLVIQLNFGNNIHDIYNDLVKIRQAFVVKELKYIKKKLSKFSQNQYEDAIFNNFGVNIILPREYEVIFNTDSIFWATYNPDNSDEIKNVLIYSFIPGSKNIQAEVLSKTDSVFASMLFGEQEGSYVRIEPLYLPYYSNNTYRGLWRLENGFMGGVFIIKTYFVDDRIVVNIGLVFAPNNRKRNYIKEFESIL